MKIAVEGCAHGELEKIYETIAYLEAQNNIKVDLLLCCGDFQASRNAGDLECMAVPPKYRQICTFYKYYSGEKVAPMLTIVIGGNHEASNHMQELPYGGWLAPNIYYLGYAGVVQVAEVRIAGLSGIFKFRDYQKGRFEMVPYSEDTKRSCYHVRALDVFRLKQLSSPIDIMLSHDWPEGVYNHGNVNALLKRKPFFREEVENNKLGSPICAELLSQLRPKHWFAAHLHVKFSALVPHEDGSETKFLALDKCLPRRQFLQVLDVPHSGEVKLEYDEEWCAILSSTDHLTSVRPSSSYMPGPGHTQRWDFKPSGKEKAEARTKLGKEMTVPLNFTVTAPPHDPSAPRPPPWCATNPQTTLFCQKLGIDDPMELLLQQTPRRNQNQDRSFGNYSSFQQSDNESFELSTPVRQRTPASFPTPKNDSTFFSPRTPLNLPGPKNLTETPESTDRSTYESPLSSFFSPRTPMSLPEPKNASDTCSTALSDSPVVCDSSKSTGGEVGGVVSSTPKKEDCVPDLSYSIDAAPTPNESDAVPSGPKKFKRRNIAMYSITGEDE